jgi:hypothetical protein
LIDVIDVLQRRERLARSHRCRLGLAFFDATQPGRQRPFKERPIHRVGDLGNSFQRANFVVRVDGNQGVPGTNQQAEFLGHANPFKNKKSRISAKGQWEGIRTAVECHSAGAERGSDVPGSSHRHGFIAYWANDRVIDER